MGPLRAFEFETDTYPYRSVATELSSGGTDENGASKRRETDGTNVRTDRALCRQFRTKRLGALRGAADSDQSEHAPLCLARRDFRRRRQDQFRFAGLAITIARFRPELHHCG